MSRTTPPEEAVVELVRALAEQLEQAERRFRAALVTARRAGLQLSLIAQAADVSVSRVHAIIEEEEEQMSVVTHPVGHRATSVAYDVLVVAAGRAAAREYYELGAYVCQEGRSFRDVDRMGFYRHRRLEPHFPRIRYWVDHVEFTRENVACLRSTGAPLDAELANLVDTMLDQGRRREGARHQVLLLTAPDDPDTLALDEPIPHTHVGRGSAWTQGTRYTSEESLRANPRTTDELD